MARYTVSLAALLLTTLAACTTAEPAAFGDADAPAPAASEPAANSPAAPTTAAQPGCNADAARSVVGQVATEQVVAQARSAAGAETARTLKPGQMVTMEFNPSRLNIDIDAGNTITNVRCG